MSLYLKIAFICLFSYVLAGCSSSVTQWVETSSAHLQGAYTDEDQKVLAFKGIPYALPPVGDLRWRSPMPLLSDATKPEHDARAFGPACPQVMEASFYNRGKMAQSENCLYLNIWTPARTTEEALPVMVWIHGGSFVNGASSYEDYDGEQFARSGVVLVNINYRLGIFGFLAHPALTEEAGGHSGNYGILDQVAALKWIKENIKNFGGDPNKVTIFGNSAGSLSVCYLTATPLAEGLFQRAIAQSGGCFGRHATLADSRVHTSDGPQSGSLEGSGHDIGVQVASMLGVPEGADNKTALNHLRNLSTEDIVMTIASSEQQAPWRSIFVDGYVFPNQMRTLYEQRKQNQVDLMLGSTTDEGTMLWTDLPKMNMRQWRSQVQNVKGKEHATIFKKLYESDAQQSTETAFQLLLSDQFFAWEARTWARIASEQDNQNIYLYAFEHAPPVDGHGRTFRAYHAAEIRYAFNNPHASMWTEEDNQVASLLHAYWVNFARTGDPNTGAKPSWTAYRTNADELMMLGLNPRMQPNFRRQKLDAHEAQLKF